MDPLRTVVCATDLSPAADEALRQGHALARLYGARLVIFHAIPNAVRSAPLFPHLALADNARFVELERKVLDGLSARAAAVTGRAPADVQVEVGFGAPHTAIIECAERSKADLIVVGGAGAPTGARALLGAVAERVARYAHCAVWVARPGPTEGPVLVATDFSDPALPAVERAVELAQRSGAKVAALHALSLPHLLVPAGMPGEVPAYPVWTQKDILQMREESAARLGDALKRFGASGQVLVDDGYAATAIVDTAQKIGARAICVGTRGRTGVARVVLGSIAEDVIMRARCSVLVVRLNPQL